MLFKFIKEAGSGAGNGEARSLIWILYAEHVRKDDIDELELIEEKAC